MIFYCNFPPLTFPAGHISNYCFLTWILHVILGLSNEHLSAIFNMDILTGILFSVMHNTHYQHCAHLQ